MARSGLISLPSASLPKRDEAFSSHRSIGGPKQDVPLVGSTPQIREYPDPVLSKRCEPVEPGGLAAQTVVDALRTAWGPGMLGLAAPQLGLSYRAIAVAAGGSFRILLNPEIVRRAPELRQHPESCLSLPGVTAAVERAVAVVVRGLDLEHGEVEFPVTGSWAAVFQHEIDHLDGILFIDRLPAKDRRAVLRAAASQKTGTPGPRIVLPLGGRR